MQYRCHRPSISKKLPKIKRLYLEFLYSNCKNERCCSCFSDVKHVGRKNLFLTLLQQAIYSMRYFPLVICLLFFSCDSGSFDSDKRQIMAKNVVRAALPPQSHNFDVLDFKEDTMGSAQGGFSHPIRYSLDYNYIDSSGTVRKEKGVVLFTPDGHSVISSSSTPNP